MPSANQLQAQIISRAMKLLRFCPIIPAHRKPPWPGYIHGLRLFTKLLVAHPPVGVCLPPEIRPVDLLRLTGYMVGSTGEAPTPSPKIISVSGAKNEPKRSLFSLLVFVDDNLSLSNMLMKESKTCKRGASRLGEAWPRPRLGRKTYWHEDKARLTGTRNYIILLLKSQQS